MSIRKRMHRDLAGQWHAADYVPPAARTMRPFQTTGVEWLEARQAGLLADDMGLGKTCQAIGAINHLPPTARILIICPAGLRINWLRELAQWLAIERRAVIAKSYIQDVPIVIVSYDSLEKFEMALRRRTWDLIIGDEAHLIRNQKAKRTRNVIGDLFTYPLQAKRKILLTGTPMPNRPIEIWPLLHFLGMPMSRIDFGNQFCGGGNFMGSSNAGELRFLLSAYMLRRMKAEVLTELPEKTRQVIRISPAGAARAAAAAEVSWEKQVGGIKPYEGGASMKHLALLRQRTALAKIALPVVQSMLREAVESHRKVVVFCYHKAAVDKVAEIFLMAGIHAVTYTGEHTQQERQRSVDRFQTEDRRMAFIGTIGAAGVGLTLTAASFMIFLEEDFTPGITDQAEDRCHRYGQANAVIVQHVVIDGSYDERQLRIQVEKAAVISSVL